MPTLRWWTDVSALDEGADYDVLVVGSGAAGSPAAIAAARTGARVLLVEKLPFLGGNSTAVLDTFYGFWTPGETPAKVVGGIGDDVVAGLRRLGPVLERPNTYGAGTGITYLGEHLKAVWESLATDAGVDVLLHASVQAVAMEGRRCTEVLLATKAGPRRVGAATFVDASGDADLCHFAGLGYEQAGAIAPAQTLTTTFRMINVDVNERKSITKDNLHDLMADAAADGYTLPRREGSDHVTPVDSTMATVMTRIDSVRGQGDALTTVSDPAFLSEVEMAGRRQALEYARFLVDRVPGYQHASLFSLGTQIGVRETRRVYGDYRVSRHDVLSAAQFDDQIGLCGAPIEDHHSGADTHWAYLPAGEAVGIPLRSLIARDADNVFVAGRCFSATHDAHASIRSMAQCMAMGQAAGTGAALAATTAEGSIRDLPAGMIRERLRAAGAILALGADERSGTAAGQRADSALGTTR